MMIYFPFGNEKCSIKDQKVCIYTTIINIHLYIYIQVYFIQFLIYNKLI